jgi:hypothetical protein
MTGEIPYYGVTGEQLWQRFGQAIHEWANTTGLKIEVGGGGSAWTGVTFPGRGRVLQVRVNANSLRCYPHSIEPQERFQALEHEPSKCSKSWKKRFPSMFTVDVPEQIALALELVTQVLSRVAVEEPVREVPPVLVMAPSS